MSDLKFRPRFRIETKLPEQEVEDRVKAKLKEDNPHQFETTIAGRHLIMKINKKNRHFWSPQMDVSLSDLENDDGTLIRCLLAPEPSVWTMFMFFYTASGIGAFTGMMIALSQWTLQREQWGWWVMLICLLLGIALFFVAQFGKGIAKDEMILLKSFIEDIDWPEPEKKA